MNRTTTAIRLAEALLQIKAIRLSPQKPFTWASGLHTPVYCDNRMILAFPEHRQTALQGLLELAESLHPFDAVAGVATAGIPHGMLVADRLDLPFLYVRSKPKSHGRQNLIEGEVPAGSRLLVVEDLISTGGSALQAVQALQKAGHTVVGVIALFQYGLPVSEEQFAAAGIPLHTVTDYPTVVRTAEATGQITSREHTMLADWHKDPQTWSRDHTPAKV